MGIFTRYKKNPDGLRQLVELWEGTPEIRRQKMIDLGMAEDPGYTQKALQYLFTFQDVLDLQDLELTELIRSVPSRFVGYAIYGLSKEAQARFISKALPAGVNEMKEILEMPNITPSQIGGGQAKLVEAARKLEKKGIIKTKRIPS